MIAYKVVTKKRESAFLGIHKDDRQIIKDYTIKYPKGKIIKAKKGTLGIFCFKDEISAIEFKDRPVFVNSKILRVESLSRKKNVQKVFFEIHSIEAYLKGDINYGLSYMETVPEGTICFDKIKVLN